MKLADLLIENLIDLGFLEVSSRLDQKTHLKTFRVIRSPGRTPEIEVHNYKVRTSIWQSTFKPSRILVQRHDVDDPLCLPNVIDVSDPKLIPTINSIILRYDKHS